jgi:hypothetical protein
MSLIAVSGYAVRSATLGYQRGVWNAISPRAAIATTPSATRGRERASHPAPATTATTTPARRARLRRYATGLAGWLCS